MMVTYESKFDSAGIVRDVKPGEAFRHFIVIQLKNFGGFFLPLKRF